MLPARAAEDAWIRGRCPPWALSVSAVLAFALAGCDLAFGIDDAVLANGYACTSAPECKSGACVDGVCCESACDGACQACNVPGTEGSCTAAPAGTPEGDLDLSDLGPGAPYTVAVVGDSYWVSAAGGLLFRVDAQTGAMQQSCAPPGDYKDGPNPLGLAFDGVDLWHTDGSTNSLYRLSPADCSVLTTCPAPTAPFDVDVADSGALLVTDGDTGRIKVYLQNCSDHYTVQTGLPMLAGVTVVHGRMYVLDAVELRVYVFDIPLESIVAAFDAPPALELRGLDYDGHHLLTADRRNQQIYRFCPLPEL